MISAPSSAAPDAGGVGLRRGYGPAPLISPDPGCHDCPHWTRKSSTTGTCDTARRRGWLTSYAYRCPDHPKGDA